VEEREEVDVGEGEGRMGLLEIEGTVENDAVLVEDKEAVEVEDKEAVEVED
jgi:hypothetical protein